MLVRLLFVLAVAFGLAVAAPSAHAEQVCEAILKEKENIISYMAATYAQCKVDKDRSEFIGSLLQSNIGERERRAIDDNALRVSAAVHHDHEKFVVGDRFDLRLEIINDTPVEFLMRLSEVQVFAPTELTLGVDGENFSVDRCFPLQKQVPLFGFDRMNSDRLEHEQGIVIPRRSSYVIIWDCSPRIAPFNFIANLHKIWFRPDKYTFSVNVPLYYNPENNRSDSPQMDLIPMLYFQSADSKTVKTDKNSVYQPVMRHAKAEVEAKLGSVFISFCSVIGGLIAVVVSGLFRQITNYAERHRERPEEFLYEQRKILFECKVLALIAILLPPLLISGASITHEFKQGISIKVFDFFGAMMAGFLVQSMIISLGQPTIDRIMDRVLARDPRDL